jgi:hypothetical protein
MTKFADDLYDDLMRDHGRALADTRPPVARRSLASHRVALTAGVGGLAVAATAGSLVAVGGSPAYALTTNHDGSVNLAVYKEAGIAQANAKFQQLNDRVVVVPVRADCPSISSVRKPAVPVKGKLRVQGSVGRDGQVTVQAEGVPRGDVILVATETSGKLRETASVVTSRPTPSCVSLPTPPTGGTGHGGGTVHSAG